MKECCKKYLDEQFAGDADIVNEIYGEYVKGNALAAGDEEMAETAIALRSAANLKDDVAAAELVSKLEKLSTLL